MGGIPQEEIVEKPRRKREDIIAGVWLLFLIIFLSGRIFSAGWDEFSARPEFIGISSQPKVPDGESPAFQAAFVPGGSIAAGPEPLTALPSKNHETDLGAESAASSSSRAKALPAV